MKPDLSIVMACYNAEKFIGFALDSVVAQNYPDLEVIIIDGLSSDRSVEISESFKDKLNIKLVSERDNGVNDAFRKGFSLANGDYICHLCATDGYFDPNWISNSVQFLKSNPEYSAIFSSGAMEIDETGSPKYLWRPWIRELYKRLHHTKHKCVARSAGEVFPDMGWMVRRKVFLELFPGEENQLNYGKVDPFLGFIKALYLSEYSFAVLPQIASYGRHHAGQWGSKIVTETNKTKKDFKNISYRYLFSFKFEMKKFYYIMYSMLLRAICFLLYGGLGYYMTKIEDRAWK